MKDFTVIPNSLLRASQLSINARYLLCVLLRYCGKKEYCYPSQASLGEDLGLSARQVSVYIKELIANSLISKTRTGFNKSNTYKVAKSFVVENEKVTVADKKSTSNRDKKSDSAHIRSAIPLHSGSELPPNNTYVIAKDNNSYKFNPKALAKFRASLEERGIIPKTKPHIRKKEKLTFKQSGNLVEVLAKKSKEISFKSKTIESAEKDTDKSLHSDNPQYGHKGGSYEIPIPGTKKTTRASNPTYKSIDERHIG